MSDRVVRSLTYLIGSVEDNRIRVGLGLDKHQSEIKSLAYELLAQAEALVQEVEHA